MPKLKPTILFISSYPPRACGIATFTQDLINALKSKINDSFNFRVCALESKRQTTYSYPKEVIYKLDTSNINNIVEVSNAIHANNNIEMVCLQHEFGLWGGEMGHNVLIFLKLLKKPVVTVFHTVLPNPTDSRLQNVEEVCHLSKEVVVMTRNSEDILKGDYGVKPGKISVIPHGTHLIPWHDGESLKEKYQLSGNIVLSTFGLLSPNKSIETSLQALPKIIENCPNVKFLILGQTHPELVRKEGERYRYQLHRLVRLLSLQNHVLFVNMYIPLHELLDYLRLTDLYIFSSKDRNQAVSGTFAYAMSCACPIISTPIPHARELLSDETGALFDFENSEGLSNAALRLMKDDGTRNTMALNAFHETRASAWENLAVKYMNVFRPRDVVLHRKFRLPKINVQHIKDLTTSFGIIQFSHICQPDFDSGYTIDDNARSLIAMIMYRNAGYTDGLDLIKTYLDFISYCQDSETGRFKNYVDKNGLFHEQNNYVNLEDSNARTVWALGSLLANRNHLPESWGDIADDIFTKTMSWIIEIESPRSIAFIIKGLYYAHRSGSNPEYLKAITLLADKLVDKYTYCSDQHWEWFENYLTYANGVMPEALIMAYEVTKNRDYLPVALNTMNFLLTHTFDKNQITVISNDGWFHRGGQKKRFGEQPIDVSYTIQALDTFYHVLGFERYLDYMQTAFSWFLGNNHLKQIIYDPLSGGCCDGLEKDGINLNQGAESTVCYLIARMILEKHSDTRRSKNKKLKMGSKPDFKTLENA